MQLSSDAINKLIDQYAVELGLEEHKDLIRRMVGVESSGDTKAVSPKGARGLMQLMPETARSMGVKNIHDPAENIRGGMKYFKQLLGQFGDVRLALAAYNAGPGNVKKYGGIPPFEETQRYVAKLAGSSPVIDSADEVIKNLTIDDAHDVIRKEAPIVEPIPVPKKEPETDVLGSLLGPAYGADRPLFELPKVDMKEAADQLAGPTYGFDQAFYEQIRKLPSPYKEGEQTPTANMTRLLSGDPGALMQYEELKGASTTPPAQVKKSRFTAEDILAGRAKTIEEIQAEQRNRPTSNLLNIPSVAIEELIGKREEINKRRSEILQMPLAQDLFGRRALDLSMTKQGAIVPSEVPKPPTSTQTATELGMLSTAKGAFDAIRWMSGERAGVTFSNLLGRMIERRAKEYDDRFVTKVFQGIGSNISFTAGGMGASAAIGTVAGVSTLLARVLGAGFSGTFEALVNAGSVYDQAKSRGMADEEANAAAMRTFLANIPVNAATDYFTFAPIFGSKGMLRNYVNPFIGNSVQEGVQSLIEDWALKDPLNWAQALDEGSIGGVVALILGPFAGLGISKGTFGSVIDKAAPNSNVARTWKSQLVNIYQAANPSDRVRSFEELDELLTGNAKALDRLYKASPEFKSWLAQLEEGVNETLDSYAKVREHTLEAVSAVEEHDSRKATEAIVVVEKKEEEVTAKPEAIEELAIVEEGKKEEEAVEKPKKVRKPRVRRVYAEAQQAETETEAKSTEAVEVTESAEPAVGKVVVPANVNNLESLIENGTASLKHEGPVKSALQVESLGGRVTKVIFDEAFVDQEELPLIAAKLKSIYEKYPDLPIVVKRELAEIPFSELMRKAKAKTRTRAKAKAKAEEQRDSVADYNRLFRQPREVTVERAKVYESTEIDNLETLFGSMLNKVNEWLDGDDTVDIDSLRKALNQLALEVQQDENRTAIARHVGVENLDGFIEAVKKASIWAQHVKRDKVPTKIDTREQAVKFHNDAMETLTTDGRIAKLRQELEEYYDKPLEEISDSEIEEYIEMKKGVTLTIGIDPRLAPRAVRALFRAAKELFRQSVPMNEIYKQTFFFLNPYDGQWRCYLDSRQASFKKRLEVAPDRILRYTLGSVLNFPQFFEVYPEAKNLPVYTFPLPYMEYAGVFIRAENTWRGLQGPFIALREDATQHMPTLLHEVQHYVQSLAGDWSLGGDIFTVRRLPKFVLRGIIGEAIKACEDRIVALREDVSMLEGERLQIAQNKLERERRHLDDLEMIDLDRYEEPVSPVAQYHRALAFVTPDEVFRVLKSHPVTFLIAYSSIAGELEAYDTEVRYGLGFPIEELEPLSKVTVAPSSILVNINFRLYVPQATLKAAGLEGVYKRALEDPETRRYLIPPVPTLQARVNTEIDPVVEELRTVAGEEVANKVVSPLEDTATLYSGVAPNAVIELGKWYYHKIKQLISHERFPSIATGEMYLNTLRRWVKDGQLREDEIVFSGLEDFLQANMKKKLHKEELLDEVSEMSVDVESEPNTRFAYLTVEDRLSITPKNHTAHRFIIKSMGQFIERLTNHGMKCFMWARTTEPTENSMLLQLVQSDTMQNKFGLGEASRELRVLSSGRDVRAWLNSLSKDDREKLLKIGEEISKRVDAIIGLVNDLEVKSYNDKLKEVNNGDVYIRAFNDIIHAEELVDVDNNIEMFQDFDLDGLDIYDKLVKFREEFRKTEENIDAITGGQLLSTFLNRYSQSVLIDPEGLALRNMSPEEALLYSMASESTIPYSSSRLRLPFSKTWPELAAKKLLYHAAKTGKEVFAWLTPELIGLAQWHRGRPSGNIKFWFNTVDSWIRKTIKKMGGKVKSAPRFETIEDAKKAIRNKQRELLAQMAQESEFSEDIFDHEIHNPMEEESLYRAILELSNQVELTPELRGKILDNGFYLYSGFPIHLLSDAFKSLVSKITSSGKVTYDKFALQRINPREGSTRKHNWRVVVRDAKTRQWSVAGVFDTRKEATVLATEVSNQIAMEADRVFKESVRKAGLDPNRMSDAEKAVFKALQAREEAFERMKHYKDFDLLHFIDRFGFHAMRAIHDEAGRLRHELIRKYGEAGNRLLAYIESIPGGARYGELKFAQMEREAFAGMQKEHVEMAKELHFLRRLFDIYKYKPKYKGPEGHSRDQVILALSTFAQRKGLTYEQFKRIWEASDIMFEHMRRAIDDMEAAKLISEEEAQNLKSHNYQRMERLDKVKDIYEVYNDRHLAGEATVKLADSGIDTLREGGASLVEVDSSILYNETFRRIYGRIANQRARVAFKEFAKLFPESGIVWFKGLRGANGRSIKRPDGYVHDWVFEWDEKEVKVVRKPLWFHPDVAKQITSVGYDFSYRLASIMGYLTGSELVRNLAVGASPIWATFIGLPFDILHGFFSPRLIKDGKKISLNASDQSVATFEPLFSALGPKYALQAWRSLKNVARDAFTRGKLFEIYGKYGGLIPFLSQRESHFGVGKKRPGKWAEFLDILSYHGQTMEMWYRLAIVDRFLELKAEELGMDKDELLYRERLKDESLILREAVHVAREHMPYGQAGWIVKAMNRIIPFMSANYIGGKTFWRAMVERPVDFSIRIGQIMAIGVGITVIANLLRPEAWRDIPEWEKTRNIVIPVFPETYNFTDNEGGTRYWYWKIPMVGGPAFFYNFASGMTEKILYEAGLIPNEPDYDAIIASIKDNAPLNQALPPAVSAFVSYVLNKDIWTGKDAFKGTPLPWPHSVVEGLGDRRVSPIAQRVGKMTELSPARLQTAAKNILPQNNEFVWAMRTGLSTVLDDAPEWVRNKPFGQILTEVPGINRWLGVTVPRAYRQTGMEGRDRQQVEFEKERILRAIEFENLIEDKWRGGLNVEDKLQEFYAKLKTPEELEYYRNREVFAAKIVNLKNRTAWLAMHGKPAELQARDFLQMEKVERSPKEQAALQEELGYLLGIGFFSENFLRELGRLREESR